MTTPPGFEVPASPPLTAPAVIVVGLTDGATLYRRFDDEESARAAWDEGLTLARNAKAFLFVEGILVAFHSKL